MENKLGKEKRYIKVIPPCQVLIQGRRVEMSKLWEISWKQKEKLIFAGGARELESLKLSELLRKLLNFRNKFNQFRLF